MRETKLKLQSHFFHLPDGPRSGSFGNHGRPQREPYVGTIPMVSNLSVSFEMKNAHTLWYSHPTSRNFPTGALGHMQ